jgi:hypothetical protein
MPGNNVGIVLQDRDRRLLEELAVLRVVDRELAKRVAEFNSTTRANARLLALTRAKFLRRFALGTIGGTRKCLYLLSPKGAAFAGVPYRGTWRSSDQILPADLFVTHQLYINEVYCAIKFRTIPLADARFVRWLSFHEPLVAEIPLIPDGYAEMATPLKTFPMFLEVDLGSESRGVWLKKVHGYLRYASSGKFGERFHQPQFRTLVVADSEKRLASLRAATATATDKIFWFTTLGAIQRDGFWSPIWQRTSGDSRQSLI